MIFILPAAIYYNEYTFATICVILLILPYFTLLRVTMKGLKYYKFIDPGVLLKGDLPDPAKKITEEE